MIPAPAPVSHSDPNDLLRWKILSIFHGLPPVSFCPVQVCNGSGTSQHHKGSRKQKRLKRTRPSALSPAAACMMMGRTTSATSAASAAGSTSRSGKGGKRSKNHHGCCQAKQADERFPAQATFLSQSGTHPDSAVFIFSPASPRCFHISHMNSPKISHTYSRC